LSPERPGPLPGSALSPAVLLLALGLAALGACSVEYGLSGAVSAEEIPDAVFRGFTHTLVEKGKRSFELKAAVAKSYSASRRVELEAVSFSEFDRVTGEVASSGKADRAIFYTDSEDAEFIGSIAFDSLREDASLEAEYLSWDAQEKRLEGRLDRVVAIRRGDGSWIRGAGFAADGKRRSVSFREAVDGAFVTTADAEAAAPGVP
jgi:LPS export ABC transporter protein LptC